MVGLRYFILFPILICTAVLSEKAYLNTCSWRVKNGNASINIPAVVPGGIYTDLRNAGILSEDIFYRFNDQAYRWVARDNWTYYCNFNVHIQEMSNTLNVLLVFDGLDTVANISFNNQYLGSTDNMFVRYDFNVIPFLKHGNNILEVKFTSPILAAIARDKLLPYKIPPDCVPSSYNGECHVNHLRKMQASFAWDWGPAFPSVGIWKDVYLERYNNISARSLSVETKDNGDHWSVAVSLYMIVSTTKNFTGTLTTTLYLSEKRVIMNQTKVTAIPDQGEASVALLFRVDKISVNMWWPNGMGQQNLYNLSAKFQLDGTSDSIESSRRIGFRTVQVVQKYVQPGNPEKGMTFFFRINGVGIFAKGSNYIPGHILPELSSNQTSVRKLLQGARDANMNMLRVWGGGLYESDFFYETCDEYGILIWQDFMFACNMYPSSNMFLNSVAVEVKQQVRRLQHHPCIAIWAGNNENEAALRGNWYGTSTNFNLYKHDYINLYVNVIKNIVLANDKTRTYVESSPSNGLKTEQEGFVSTDPGSTLFGDVHYYNYLNNLWNPDIYPLTRFASEYGVQSLPSMETLSSVALPSDLVSLNTDFMNARQHLPGGYIFLKNGVEKNLPKASSLDDLIYLSQIYQAVSIKTETEFYRRGRSSLTSSGEGLTMGALYWQLNDVWQAPSWSSLEFGGKWKMLHYFAKDFFSPILVSPRIDILNVLRVSVISDLFVNVPVILKMAVYRWDSLQALHTESYTFVSYASRVLEAGSWDLRGLLSLVTTCGSNFNEAKTKCFLQFSLRSNNSSNIVLGPDNFVFPMALHSISGLKEANIKVILINVINSKQFELTLRTDAIALFVWLEVLKVPGHFSRNGFIMTSEVTRVTFFSDIIIDKALLQSKLKIKLMKANYTLDSDLKSVLLQ